jgi:hypothetical protein
MASIRVCPITGYDVNDTQMILFQACGSDMAEKEKFDDEKTTRHDFATKRVNGLIRALLKGDANGVDVLYCGDKTPWVRIKDANAAEEIAKRVTLHGKITNLAEGLRSCVEKHKDYCNNNPDHKLTTVVILTSGKTSNHTLFSDESEGKKELQTLIKELADRCQNAGEPQIRVVFAPVAPEEEGKQLIYSICMPEKRQKLIATQISLLHPIDRESIMRMASVYDKYVYIAD